MGYNWPNDRPIYYFIYLLTTYRYLDEVAGKGCQPEKWLNWKNNYGGYQIDFWCHPKTWEDSHFP